jgi:hypothetical protein
MPGSNSKSERARFVVVNTSTNSTFVRKTAPGRITSTRTALLALALFASAAAACGAGADSTSDQEASDVRSGRGGPRGGAEADGPPVAPYGILFVTQVPVAGFNVVTSTFGNHDADVRRAPRGGDLWVRYDDGTLRNLTAEAGLGQAGLQGDKAIAVREPSVHWGGRKALFSMAVGAPTQRYGSSTAYRWQVYEVEGLGRGETVRVTKVPNQPADYDNVAPFYGTDDRVLFASTRPRSGEAHLYPQLDEYESSPTNAGLYSLDPTTGDLFLVNHAPSGAFSPSIDSAGRIVFTKWDHLQRDQQEEYDRLRGTSHGSFDFAGEAAAAAHAAPSETFPEARAPDDPRLGPDETPLVFNQFFPWEVREDGSGEETLNHVGRHEFGGAYSEGSFRSDPNLTYQAPPSAHQNRVYVKDAGGLFDLIEDPAAPGTFYGVNAAEFATETAGQLVRFNGAPGTNPDEMVIAELTPAVTRLAPSGGGDASHTGHYRDPLPLASGELVASHTAETRPNVNDGSVTAPNVRYKFRLKTLEKSGAYYVAGAPLTGGIRKALSWWTPDQLATWEGELWELNPVELRSRPRPGRAAQALPAPERAIFEQEGVSEAALRAWMAQNQLALVVSRNVTSRDRGDVQQPFNLRVPGGAQTLGAGGKVYDVSALQLLQGDQVRGYQDRKGRRTIARPMHESAAAEFLDGDVAGGAEVAPDGSVASFVPARRAMTWQLVDPAGAPVVRERNWVSFAPGEVRACPSCHGVNTADQAGRPAPENPPEALRSLLRAWKQATGG